METEATIGGGPDGKGCEGSGCDGWGTFAGKVVVLLWGPSASGKTFGASSNIGELLAANKLPPDLKFHSVDGGKIRDVSRTWQWGVNRCISGPLSAGCADLFDHNKDFLGKAKKELTGTIGDTFLSLVLWLTAEMYFPRLAHFDVLQNFGKEGRKTSLSSKRAPESQARHPRCFLSITRISQSSATMSYPWSCTPAVIFA